MLKLLAPPHHVFFVHVYLFINSLLVQNPDGRGVLVTGHAQLPRDGFGVELVIKLAYSRQRFVFDGVRVDAENQALLVDQREVRVQGRRVTQSA